MARVASRKTRSDKQRDSRRWLNTEVIDFWLRTRMLRRFPATPTHAVVMVATPEHQNIILWKKTECSSSVWPISEGSQKLGCTPDISVLTLTCKNRMSYSAEHSRNEMFVEKVWFTIILLVENSDIGPILGHLVW